MRSFSQDSQRLLRKAFPCQVSPLEEILNLTLTAPRLPSLPNPLLCLLSLPLTEASSPTHWDFNITSDVKRASTRAPVRLSVSTKRTNWLFHQPSEEGVFPQPPWECWRLSQRCYLELPCFSPYSPELLTHPTALILSPSEKKMYTMNWSSAHAGHFLHDLVCQWLQLCACSLQLYRSSVDSSGLVCLCTPKHGLMWSVHPCRRKHLEGSQESLNSGRKRRTWFHTHTLIDVLKFRVHKCP